jgi:hypothetical protein
MHSRNIPITRPPFRIITRDAFRETHKDSAQKHSVIGDLHQFTANTILAHYLGGAWLRRYIDPSSRHVSPYLRIDAEAELEVRAPQYMRYWEFAETLLNMQDVPGFETVLDELIHGKIESACGELYVARMIMFHGLRFRFVSPVGGIGQNYAFITKTDSRCA